MEQLIQGLVDKVKALEARETQGHQANLDMKKELHQLQKKLKSYEEKESREKPAPVVYVKSERKFQKFRGRPEKDTDPDVNDWITEMREHKFYQRDQKDSETLENYSRVLLQMMERINRRVDKKMQILDINITERFIDGIKDRTVGQELRKIVVEKGPIPFQEFRLGMLKWVDDNPPKERKVCASASVSTERTDAWKELLQKQQLMLEKQQEQINALQNTLEKVNEKKPYSSPNGRGRGKGNNKDIVCYTCTGKGHFARDCPSPPNKKSKPKSDPNGNPPQ
ncbi:uncharacterized protein LOC130053687 [Ostrea edulis]|uniref:uncharacterized protein LOC130053687 n=1 Tax=Ostrea edulis TaxID=37623 RepID=UPI0024AF9D88|nr:uncharacterized protein LOC130053687 [Ostrea edulis]